MGQQVVTAADMPAATLGVLGLQRWAVAAGRRYVVADVDVRHAGGEGQTLDHSQTHNVWHRAERCERGALGLR